MDDLSAPAADPDAGYPYDSLPMADWLDQVRTQTFTSCHGSGVQWSGVAQ